MSTVGVSAVGLLVRLVVFGRISSGGVMLVLVFGPEGALAVRGCLLCATR